MKKAIDWTSVNQSSNNYRAALAIAKSQHGKEIKRLKGLLEEQKELVKRKNAVLHRLSVESDFIRRRIKALYGNAAYEKIMNTTDCPGGFDAENFRAVSQKKELQ